MPRDPAKYPLDDRIRAQHMVLAAQDVVQISVGRTRDDLRTDMIFRRAMVNAIQEIGEAASKVSPAGRARITAVPWPTVVGMRNRLVHGYDQIDFDIVWHIATQEAGPLIAALEAAFVLWPLPEPPED